MSKEVGYGVLVMHGTGVLGCVYIAGEQTEVISAVNAKDSPSGHAWLRCISRCDAQSSLHKVIQGPSRAEQNM